MNDLKRLRAKVGKIAEDLLNLEINTIIKPNITGEKMPSPRHALIGIAGEFSSKLTDLGFPLSDLGIKDGSYRSFDMLRESANKGVKTFQKSAAEKSLKPEEEADLLMLHRIKNMSDQIKGVFNALQRRRVEKWDNNFTHQEIEKDLLPFPLNPDELVLIRKVWEVGVEEIALQTVIQLDGDVVTRVMPKYATSRSEALHKIHEQSVSVSMKSWQELIGVVKDFFGTIVKIFL